MSIFLTYVFLSSSISTAEDFDGVNKQQQEVFKMTFIIQTYPRATNMSKKVPMYQCDIINKNYFLDCLNNIFPSRPYIQ
jgi:hypothetical protein